MLRLLDGLADLGQQARLVGTQFALEHQIVGSVVAAKYRVFELQTLQQAFDLDEQGTPIQRLEIGEASTETLLAGRKLTTRVDRYSGWAAFIRRAELSACCALRVIPPRPLRIITERLIPASPSFSSASRVEE